MFLCVGILYLSYVSGVEINIIIIIIIIQNETLRMRLLCETKLCIFAEYIELFTVNLRTVLHCAFVNDLIETVDISRICQKTFYLLFRSKELCLFAGKGDEIVCIRKIK